MRTDNQDPAAHLVPESAAVGLSELESMSINGVVVERNDVRREDNFPLTYRAALVMGLFLDGVLFDMMVIVKIERPLSMCSQCVCSLFPRSSPQFRVNFTLTVYHECPLDILSASPKSRY